MKKALSVIVTLVMVLAMAQVGAFKASAAQSGDYTYSVSGSKAEITDYTGDGGAVSIPATLGGYPVTKIDGRVFSYCTELTSVAIPDSVTVIDPEAFGDCTGLTAITVGSGNSQYSSSGGVLFDKNGSNLIIYPCGKPGSYSIPGGTTGIGDDAFEDCAGLTGVTIPGSVTSIGFASFSGCTGLPGVTIPDDVTFAGVFAFGGCTNLSSVTVGSGITVIADCMFQGCTKLASITLPDSVTSIGDQAFGDCIGLTGITLPDKITAIGDYAFVDCAKLAGLTLPDSVTSIGDSAFSNCTELTGITLPDKVTAISEYLFAGCSKLAGVTILGSVTSIGEGAFSGCSVLSSFTIPDSVTSIGAGAFANCVDLTDITIPQKVISIGTEVFFGCTKLSQIEVDVSNTHYLSVDGVLFNELKTALLAYPGGKAGSYDIPAGVTSLSEAAFAYCTKLTDVTLPSSVTSTGDGEFFECTELTKVTINGNITAVGNGMFEYCAKLTGITIPNSVKSIGDYAFSGCFGLTSATIGSGVASIGECAFIDCEKLPQFTVISGNQHYLSLNGVLYNKAMTSLIQYPGAKTGSCAIPSSVTSIADGAFYYSSKLTGATIPNSVTSIGQLAFDGCTALTQITVGTGNPSYLSSGGALYDKAKTDLIAYPAGKAGSYTIPTGVTFIDDAAFNACAGLTDVTIPNSVIFIGSDAFSSCTGLTSVIIPGSTEHLGSDAFGGCSALASVYFLGNAPIFESDDVFAGCSSALTMYSVSGNTGFPLDGYTNATFTPAAVTAPAGLTAVSGGYNSVKLSWSAASAAGLPSGYQIWRSTSKTGPYSLVGTTTATSYINVSLTAGTTYYYEVRAVRVDGNTNSYSSYTGIASARPIPPTPTGQKAASASYSSVKLTWNAVSGASGYGIYRSTSATGAYTLIANTTSTSYTNTGLTAGKAYYYKISAYRAVGSAKIYGGLTAAVGVKPIPAMVSAAATRYSSTGIRVSWGAIGGASGYEVYRSTSASGTYSLIKTTTSTSLVNTGLTKGKTYYYKVRAYRMVGSTKVYGAFSAVKSAKP